MDDIQDAGYYMHIVSCAQRVTMPIVKPAKRATNLSLSADVLQAAKDLDINLSQVCDNYLREFVRTELERNWRKEYAEFISAYNATIEQEGLPLEEWKSF